MTFTPVYPHPCRDCGTQVASEADRYKGSRRCRPCGLAAGRARQRRVQARKRGEDVPLQKYGPPTTVYPFPCKGCGVAVKTPAERGENFHMCRPCMSRYRRASAVKKRYGLPVDEYEAMVAASGGVCDICKRPPKRRGLAVDHDHATGEVRGLLCFPCNWMLGNADDSTERLRAAIAYLQAPRP